MCEREMVFVHIMYIPKFQFRFKYSKTKSKGHELLSGTDQPNCRTTTILL